MEGTYGTAFPPNASPMSPNTPTSASTGQYKTNVNRTKTRKWVEAKVQSYDGDDWGNEYDEEEPEPEEPPMPPPPRVTGFRQPGQGLSSSSQPASPALGPTQPAGAPAHSTGVRGVSGPPALHIQTQPPPSASARPGPTEMTSPLVSGPSSLGSATIEQIVSPQSANPIQAGAPGAYAAVQDFPQRVVSPSSDRRMSPAPPSAAQVPSRFPPRESSISQQEQAEIPDVARFSQSSSRPSSSHSKPWLQDRPASPSGPRSPGTPSKPLPFIRPADIYRRMEEEKEKERRSMDSSRPSMDSVTGRGLERVASPTKLAHQPVEDQQEATVVRDEGSGADTGPGEPPQPLVMQKSDYNYQGILAGAPGPAPKSVATVSEPSNHPPHYAHIPTQQQRDSMVSQGSSDDDRRFSTSPKLPDLARMSAFGADLFAGSSGFSSNAPPLPSIPDNSPPESAVKSPRQLPSQEDVISAPSDSSLPVEPSPPTAAREGENEPPLKADDSASAAAGAGLLRPSLPGGWVTETATTPGDSSTPSNVLDITARDSGGVSPVTESGTDTDQSHGAPAQDLASGDGTSEPVGEESDSRGVGLGVLQNVTPQSLPPLNTADAVPTSSEFQLKETGSSPPQPPPKDSPRTQPTSPTPDTAASDIAPTAPLQPHKGETLDQDFRPEAIQRISTMSTVTNSSPVKESDVLREEIIKTLSPIRSSELFLNVQSPVVDEPSEPADRNPVRESAYLDDVYGDYWAGNDKKPDAVAEEDETGPAQEVTAEETTPPLAVPEMTATQIPQQQEAAPAPVQSGLNRNRFSWELESEDMNPTAAQISPPPPESVNIPLPSSDQSTPLSPAGHQHDIPQLTVETGTGGISHQVSQASTLPPRRESEIPEPPSPVSVLTDRNAPPPEEGRRLSLAEEKVLIQASSHPVSPTPPSEQHPALAETSRSTPRTATPITPSSPKPDLMSFRQILDLPNTSDRIAKYQETRAQFAGIDSGLDEWLVHIRSHIPEHANASGSFTYPLGMAPPGADGQNHPAVAVPPGVQPYYQQYQQYLSASTTNLNSPPGGRPVGGLAGSSQFGSSDMRHSGAQVGAKGKELLKVAGKAGKGLWGKSKNKLRGTGDKDDSSPPSSPPASPTIITVSTPVKEKKDKSRRTSWGLASLGVRSSRSGPPRPASFGGAAAPSSPAAPAQFAQAGVPSHPGPAGRHPGLLGSLTSSATSRNAPGAHANPNPNVNPTAAPSISSSSLPFQLPQPSRISPFNSNSFLSHGDGNNSSSSSPFPPPPHPPQASHQTPQTPERSAARASTSAGVAAAAAAAGVPESARRNSQPELVSPVSETFSRSTPAPTSTAIAAPPQPHSQFHAGQLGRQHEQDFHDASNLHVPRPISKHQPSWDPFTGTPLYEEEGFDLDDPTPQGPSHHQHHQTGAAGSAAAAAAVLSSAPARTSVHSSADDAKNVITDDRSDDWVVVSPQPRPPSSPAQIRTVPTEHQPHPQLSQPRGAGHSMPPSQGPVTSANISGPSGQPQADSSSSPHRQSSFVGLPPIRRSSTFGMSLTKATEELTVKEGDNTEPPAANPSGATNMSQVAMNPQQASSPPPGQPMQGGYYMMQGQPGIPQGFAGPGGIYYQHPGMQQQQLPQGYIPPQMNAQMAQRGMPGPSMMSAGPGQQQFRPGPQFMQPQQPGMVPPNMMANGNPIQRFPPQGPGWKLEESHLSEPLQSARHRASPSNASASPSADQGNYGFDKETGAPSVTSVSPPIQSPTQQRPPEAAPQGNVSRFGPGQQPRQPHQGDQPPQSNFQQPVPAFAQPQNNMLARSQTNEIQSPQLQDDNENKRNSGIFSGIRDRFGSNARERRDSLNGPRFQGPAVTGDGVSETSVATEDLQDRKKRQSTLFNLRGPGSGSESISPPSRQSTFDQQSQPLEKKRTFFSKPSGLGGPSLQAPQARPELSRASTSDSSNPTGPGGDGQPKKRFSALKGMVHKLGGHQEHSQQQQGPPATAHSMQSSMQGQQPPPGFAPSAQPSVNGPPQMSGAAGPPQGRPFTADTQGRKPSMQGPPVSFGGQEPERGRRTSGGGFLSGILGKRSDSKSRDSRPQQGQPQQGQMMLQPGQHPGQMVMMQPGQQGQFPMQQGQFQQFHGRPVGPQGQPLGPPGQFGPAGQPQFLAQQGGRGGPLTPQQMQMMMQQQQGQMQGQQRLMTPQHPSPGPNQNISPLAQHPVGPNAQRPGMPPQQPSQSSIQAEQPLQRSPQPDSEQQSAPPAQPTVQTQDDEPQGRPSQSSPGPQIAAPQILAQQAGPRPVEQPSQSEPAVNDPRQPQPSPQPPLGDTLAQSRASTQTSSTVTPQPSLQAPARKPVGSSPAPVVNQQQAPQANTLVASQPDQRSSIASSVQQSPKIGSQGSPQLRRVSTPSAGQNLQPGAQTQTAAAGAQLPNISAQSTPSASPAPQAGQQAPPPASSPHPGMVNGPQGAQQLQQGPPGQAQFQQPGGPGGPGMQPQGQWVVSRASTQVSNISGPTQPGQQYMQRPPQNMQMSPPPQQEQQSTFSKLLGKAKPSGQPTSQGPGAVQQRPQKQEKGSKSLFSAFKRSSKQPEPNQPPPGGPQYGPGQGPQRMQPTPQMMQQMQRPPNGMQQPQPQTAGQQVRPGPYMQYQNQRQSPPNQQGPQPVPGASPQQPTGFQAQGPGQLQPGQPQPGQPQPGQPQPGQLQQQGPQGPQGQQFAQQRPMPQPQPMAMGGPRPVNQRQPSNQRPGEPQYAQVPIPAGYAPVHGEGMLVPSPYNIGRAPSWGQYPNPQAAQQYYQQQQQQQQQQWGPQAHVLRQVSPGIPQGQQPMSPPQQAQPGAPAPEQLRASPQPQQAENHLASQPPSGSPQPAGLAPTPQATPGLSPVSSSSPGNITQMNTISPDSQGQRPQPERITTDASQFSTGSQPIIQHPGSPQNYPLPESSTFSPVNTAAGNLPNPPLPQNFVVTTESQRQEQVVVDQNTGLAPQRQPSAVSQLSSVQPSPPVHQQHTIANVISGGANNLGSQVPQQAASPSPQITPERNVSPEPSTSVQQSPVNLNVNVQAANNAQEDNIYDATPRNSVPPPVRQEQPADVVIESPSAEPASKFAGRPQDLAETRSTISTKSEERPKDLVIETAPPAATQPATNGHERPPNGNGRPVQSSADIFEEMKRKQLLREQEEKIPVNPTEPDMNAAAAAAAKKKDEDDVPQMSATSYPGQEWNPYGGAEYEDWND